jgi:hypothetical protein
LADLEGVPVRAKRGKPTSSDAGDRAVVHLVRDDEAPLDPSFPPYEYSDPGVVNPQNATTTQVAALLERAERFAEMLLDTGEIELPDCWRLHNHTINVISDLERYWHATHQPDASPAMLIDFWARLESAKRIITESQLSKCIRAMNHKPARGQNCEEVRRRRSHYQSEAEIHANYATFLTPLVDRTEAAA